MRWEGRFNKVKAEVEELKGAKKGLRATLQAKESKYKADLARQQLVGEKATNALQTTNKQQCGKIAELKALLSQQSREIISLNKREQANIQLEHRHAAYMMAEEHKRHVAEQK